MKQQKAQEERLRKKRVANSISRWQEINKNFKYSGDEGDAITIGNPEMREAVFKKECAKYGIKGLISNKDYRAETPKYLIDKSAENIHEIYNFIIEKSQFLEDSDLKAETKEEMQGVLTRENKDEGWVRGYFALLKIKEQSRLEDLYNMVLKETGAVNTSKTASGEEMWNTVKDRMTINLLEKIARHFFKCPLMGIYGRLMLDLPIAKEMKSQIKAALEEGGPIALLEYDGEDIGHMKGWAFKMGQRPGEINGFILDSTVEESTTAGSIINQSPLTAILLLDKDFNICTPRKKIQRSFNGCLSFATVLSCKFAHGLKTGQITDESIGAGDPMEAEYLGEKCKISQFDWPPFLIKYIESVSHLKENESKFPNVSMVKGKTEDIRSFLAKNINYDYDLGKNINFAIRHKTVRLASQVEDNNYLYSSDEEDLKPAKGANPAQSLGQLVPTTEAKVEEATEGKRTEESYRSKVKGQKRKSWPELATTGKSGGMLRY